MRIEELLDKRERAIYQLVVLLQTQPANHFVKDLADQLGLSRTTLLRYIDSFRQDAQAADVGISLYVQGEQVIYRREPGLSQQAYLRFLAQSSIKYQVLSEIFDKEEFTIQSLSQRLLLSEASLNRQLSALNQLLEEFGLVIRNGRLKGSELQIRYLYFQLFWHFGGTSQQTLEDMTVYQQPLVQALSRFYDQPFTPKQTDQCLLWLFINQKRMRLAHLDFTALYQLMQPYQDYKFYDRLRQLVFTFYDQMPGGVKEGEVMCLFVFLFFMFILGAPQVEQMLAFGGPIKEATTLGLTYLREVGPEPLLLNEEALYHLNQLLGQAYFFRGQISLPRQELALLGFSSQFRQLARTVYQEVLHQVYHQESAVTSDFESWICQSLEQLFHYITMAKPSHLKIGVKLSGDKVTNRPLLAQLRKELEQNRYIFLEEWQSDHTYALVIADYPDDAPVPVYLLTAGLTKGDILALKNVIKQLSNTNS